jgi:hypothetical protein
VFDQNRSRKLFGFIVGLATYGAGSAIAEGEKGLAADLAHYVPVSQALADDKLDGIKDHAEALAKSGDKAIADAATALARATDIASARKAFGDVSRTLIAALEVAAKRGEKLPTFHVFECPMAKPYGKWIQDTKETANPYFGSAMRRCGKRVSS